MKTQLLALSMVAAAPQALAQDATFLANATLSHVQWHGAKVIGGGHTGTVKVKAATVVFDGDNVKSGDVTVDMSSIVDDDLTSAEWNTKLVGHLKSADFFDVEKFPTANLSVKSAESKKTGEYLVKGALTIKGKSLPVEFTATETRDGDRRTVKADVAFDRTAYGIKYGSGKFFQGLGDKMIADEVKFSVELVLEPQGKKSAQK